jgi:hypothetical protein
VNDPVDVDNLLKAAMRREFHTSDYNFLIIKCRIADPVAWLQRKIVYTAGVQGPSLPK